MVLKKLFFLLIICCPCIALAENNEVVMQTADEILALAHKENPTECASKIFAQALDEKRDEINEDDSEAQVYAWAEKTMLDPDVLERVLQCPELASNKVEDNTTIFFTPIVFKFANDRSITINYTTQPKIIKQKILVGRKPSLPNGNPNPKLMDWKDPAKYINTDPSWYAIMVVQHDSLSDFVGEGKNNTVSLKYLEDNFKKIYPKGRNCTSQTAIARDSKTINQVVKQIANLEEDSNDYFVYGNKNLEWVMYAEIALEVAITVVSMGAGEAALSGARLLRASKNAKASIKTVKNLIQLEKVKEYVAVSRQIAKHTKTIENMNKNIVHANNYAKYLNKAAKARSAGNTEKAVKYEKEAQNILKEAKKLDPDLTEETFKAENIVERQKNITKEITPLEEQANEMVKNSDDVKKFKEQSENIEELIKIKNEMKAFRHSPSRAQTGNIITRTFRSIKAIHTSADKINKGGRIARKGMSTFSDKARNWLFNTTLKHGERIAKLEIAAGGLYGVVSILGDLFDKTSSTSAEYTNGIQMRPIGLLGADDIDGEENVVNYGVWLKWVGNSTDPVDDDAAYLQAMDFASKFNYKLHEYQDEHGKDCNVDIYVVHPIIRLDETDPEKISGELFYLFMNDNPWTTADQFDGSTNSDDDDYTTDSENFNQSGTGNGQWNNWSAYSGPRTPKTEYNNHDYFCNDIVGDNQDIIRSEAKCSSLSDSLQKTRCAKCVRRAGTFENNHCYIEILEWRCKGKGWDGYSTTRTCKDEFKYNGCSMIRKYADAEQSFECDNQGELSGCCHHVGKRPPSNIEKSITELNCKTPLADNLDWRIANDGGSGILINGQKTGGFWCMPGNTYHPWNPANQPGGATHCGRVISGGTVLQKWLDID